MNTNKILQESGFSGHPQYRDIALLALSLSKEGKSREEILNSLKEVYKPKIKYLSNKITDINVFGTFGEDIDWSVERDISGIAKVPVVERLSLMPDAHTCTGADLPVGGVVQLNNAIVPGWVGVDIGCRMSLSLLDLQKEEVEKDKNFFLNKILENTSFGNNSGFENQKSHSVMQDPLWSESNLLKSLKPIAERQLGSSGGGNHFVDLIEIEFLRDYGNYRQGDKCCGLLAHSGSRGTGFKVAKHFIKKAIEWAKWNCSEINKKHAWLPMDTEEGQNYFRHMKIMGKYAQACHHLIHEDFSKSINKQIDFFSENFHNFAWKEEDKIIIRKGATPAKKGLTGIIPGSCVSNSYLVEGLGNPDSLESSSHGAGRKFSRTKAIETFNLDLFKKECFEKNILCHGVSADEAGQGYKDIEEVIKIQEDANILTKVAVMRPLIVVMGG